MRTGVAHSEGCGFLSGLHINEAAAEAQKRHGAVRAADAQQLPSLVHPQRAQGTICHLPNKHESNSKINRLKCLFVCWVQSFCRKHQHPVERFGK